MGPSYGGMDCRQEALDDLHSVVRLQVGRPFAVQLLLCIDQEGQNPFDKPRLVGASNAEATQATGDRDVALRLCRSGVI